MQVTTGRGTKSPQDLDKNNRATP